LGFYEDTLDGKYLAEVLKSHLLPSCRRLFPSGQFYILHDNDSRWKSPPVTRFLHDNYLPDLPHPWPVKSPDLNPCENLWSDLAERVWDRNPCGVDQLKELIIDEWDKTDKKFLRHLAHSMPTRCKKVIESNGHKIDY